MYKKKIIYDAFDYYNTNGGRLDTEQDCPFYIKSPRERHQILAVALAMMVDGEGTVPAWT